MPALNLPTCVAGYARIERLRLIAISAHVNGCAATMAKQTTATTTTSPAAATGLPQAESERLAAGHALLSYRLESLRNTAWDFASLHPEELQNLSPAEQQQQIADILLAAFDHSLRYDSWEVRLRNPQSQQLTVWLTDSKSLASQEHGLVANPEGNGVQGYVASNGTSYVSEDVARDPLCRPRLATTTTMLGVPLLFRDEVLGVVSFEKSGEVPYNEDDVRFVETVAFLLTECIHSLVVAYSNKPRVLLAKLPDFVPTLFGIMPKHATKDLFSELSALLGAFRRDESLIDELRDKQPDLCRELSALLRSVESQSPTQNGDDPQLQTATLPKLQDLGEVARLTPTKFFRWFDKHLNSESREVLRHGLTEFASVSKGKDFGSHEKNSAFASRLNSCMKAVSLLAVCPGAANAGCGRRSYFRAKKHPSYPHGVFYFEHADEGQATHGWSAKVPEIRFVERDG